MPLNNSSLMLERKIQKHCSDHYLELMGGDCTTGSPLPPGFRFCPTDEELVTHYLSKKAADPTFTSAAVRDVDLYKSEPWDLLLPSGEAPAPATGTEEERCCYFFCTRSVKYPSGLRTNRATATGYWKSTGQDKEVLRHGGDGDVRPVGVKKTLVFYKGRAPRGEKTNWVMHEYRLVQGVDASSPTAFVRGARSEWVICRVFLRKPPGDHHKIETGQYNQEAALHPPLDHLRPSMAPVPAVSDDYTGHVNSNAISIASGDHHNTEDMIHRDHQEGLLKNYSGYASPHALLASPVVYLPQLLEYESFSQDLI